MKKSNTTHKLMLAGMASLFLLMGTSRTLLAHDGDWDSNHHYYVDKHGFWDDHDKYQKFILYKNHHGYWDTKGDKKVFIRVDAW